MIFITVYMQVRSSHAKGKRPTSRHSCIPYGVAEVLPPPEQQYSIPMPILFSFSQLQLVHILIAQFVSIFMSLM